MLSKGKVVRVFRTRVWYQSAEMGMPLAASLATALALAVMGGAVAEVSKPPTGLGSKPHEAAGMSEVDYMLMDAVAEGEIEEIKRLIAEGADVNAKNSEGETPVRLRVCKRLSPPCATGAALARLRLLCRGSTSSAPHLALTDDCRSHCEPAGARRSFMSLASGGRWNRCSC